MDYQSVSEERRVNPCRKSYWSGMQSGDSLQGIGCICRYGQDNWYGWFRGFIIERFRTRTSNRMIPCFDSGRNMVPLCTALELVPPGCSKQVAVAPLLHIFDPFRTSVADAGTYPVDGAYCALLLVFPTCGFYLRQVGEPQGERRMRDRGERCRSSCDYEQLLASTPMP